MKMEMTFLDTHDRMCMILSCMMDTLDLLDQHGVGGFIAKTRHTSAALVLKISSYRLSTRSSKISCFDDVPVHP